MTRRKAKYKQDICPNCTPETLQVFLVGHNELPEPFVQASKIVLHAKLETYSLFRCEKCKSILLYRTIVDDTDWGPEELDEKNPDWVTEWEDEEFSKLSELLYFTHPFQQEPSKAIEGLPEQVPKNVR